MMASEEFCKGVVLERREFRNCESLLKKAFYALFIYTGGNPL